ncbi:MAG: hypothetical protein ACE3L7_04690 [Candidatus Pristimantibacillus sp.]
MDITALTYVVNILERDGIVFEDDKKFIENVGTIMNDEYFEVIADHVREKMPEIQICTTRKENADGEWTRAFFNMDLEEYSSFEKVRNLIANRKGVGS